MIGLEWTLIGMRCIQLEVHPARGVIQNNNHQRGLSCKETHLGWDFGNSKSAWSVPTRSKSKGSINFIQHLKLSLKTQPMRKYHSFLKSLSKCLSKKGSKQKVFSQDKWRLHLTKKRWIFAKYHLLWMCKT